MSPTPQQQLTPEMLDAQISFIDAQHRTLEKQKAALTALKAECMWRESEAGGPDMRGEIAETLGPNTADAISLYLEAKLEETETGLQNLAVNRKYLMDAAKHLRSGLILPQMTGRRM